jgi:hypothetical protein
MHCMIGATGWASRGGNRAARRRSGTPIAAAQTKHTSSASPDHCLMCSVHEATPEAKASREARCSKYAQCARRGHVPRGSLQHGASHLAPSLTLGRASLHPHRTSDTPPPLQPVPPALVNMMTCASVYACSDYANKEPDGRIQSPAPHGAGARGQRVSWGWG